ncbi:MAG: GAF domain-containing sensor histidine kinase [Gemmatimonadaceae bacterium]
MAACGRIPGRVVRPDEGNGIPNGPAHPSARILRLRQPEFVPEVTEDWIRETATPEHAAFLRGLRARSVLRVPLIDGEQPLGVLTLGTTEPGREFNERDLALGSNIAARLTASLRNARLYSELQRAVRIRDEVMSIVSHDLKDPVHTVRMATSLLLDPELGAAELTRQQQLTMIRRCATRMAQLLEDLLDVAKSEGSSLAVAPRPTDVAPLIQEVVDAFRLSAADRGVALQASVPGELPLVAADDRRIVQVLTNLCANALKFTPRGGSVSVLAEPNGQAVRLCVADSGIGIPRDSLDRVFDRFWQAKRASRASAGLGLAIAKSIVEAHGGEMWVESAEGRGTQFHFTLPRASGESSSSALQSIGG